MAGTYADVATLAADTTFQQKMQVAMIDAAVAIMGEATNTPQFDARRALAVSVLAQPSAQVARVALIAAASNATFRAAAPAVPSDGDVAFVVASLWTALAVK